MKALLQLLLVLGLSGQAYGLSSDALSEMPDVLLEVSIAPNETHVGQKRQLALTVLTSSWFTGANEFPYLEIDRALIQQPESFATNASVQRNGISYSTQTRTYNIYPNAEGVFVTPPLSVVAHVAAIHTLGAIKKRLYLPPQVFTVSPWLTAPAPVIFATDVSLRQRFDLPIDTLQQGDALMREIIVTAADTLGVLIPTITMPTMKNAQIYAQQADVSERRNRGESVSRSKQVFSYVFEADGSYELPEIVMPWWNENSQAMAMAVLPAVQINVQASGVTKIGGPKLFFIVVAGLILMVGLLCMQRFTLPFIKRVVTAEALHFWQLRRVIGKRDEEFLRRYYEWEYSFIQQYGQAPTKPTQLAELMQAFYSATATVHCGRSTLVKALVQSRSADVAVIKRAKKQSKAILPSLNNTAL